jgi:hypothetical protein
MTKPNSRFSQCIHHAAKFAASGQPLVDRAIAVASIVSYLADGPIPASLRPWWCVLEGLSTKVNRDRHQVDLATACDLVGQIVDFNRELAATDDP